VGHDLRGSICHRDRRRSGDHCNLIHHDTGFKADIYIAFDELHRWALAHRRTVTLDGLNISVAPVEYVILVIRSQSIGTR